MGYEVHAVIGAGGLLRACAAEFAATRLGTLRQGLAIMPMTDALFDAVTDRPADDLGFLRLPGGFARTPARWSLGGPLAYAEADYFGGAGEQRAAVWDGGDLVLGPLSTGIGAPFPSAGSPISQALRRLGVERGDAADEFAASGLPERRRDEDWIG